MLQFYRRPHAPVMRPNRDGSNPITARHAGEHADRNRSPRSARRDLPAAARAGNAEYFAKDVDEAHVDLRARTRDERRECHDFNNSCDVCD
jgi:hypothetical protein